MLSKFKKITNNDLLKVSSLNAFATAIKLLTSFVSVKVIAVLIGPAGIALLGQLSNFSSILLTISTGGINNGVTKYLAEHANNPGKEKIFLRASFWITLVLSSLCAITLIFFSSAFSKLILKDVGYQSIFIIFGFTIVLYAFNSLIISILNGYKQFRKIVTVNILNSLLGLAFSVSLVFLFGIYGALLAIVTYQSIIFIITLFLVRNCEWGRISNFIGRFNRPAGLKLAQYSIMALVSAATIPISQLIIRSFISTRISVNAAGIWEGMNRISSLYLMVITTSLSVYYLPRLSELKSDSELRAEIIGTYKVVVPVILVISSLIFLLKNLIIHILFNKGFLNMSELFAFQLLGDTFKIFSWVLGYQFVAKTMTAYYVTMEILFTLCLVGISMYFISLYGTIGATIGYMITYFLYFLSMIAVFRKLLFKR
jgi:PST family polysaccharide transporter